MIYVQYRWGQSSPEARRLIVGKPGDANPLADRRTNLLPANKLRINESLFIHKDEVDEWKWKLAKATVIRYNAYVDCLRVVETSNIVEIVRIK